MQTIEQTLREVQALHEQLMRCPAPEIAPHAFLPFPYGEDPVAYAIQEVAQLKQLIESGRIPRAQGQQPSWVPRASVYAGESGVTFEVELPGIGKEDVNVTAVGGELVVRGQRKASTESGRQPLVLEQAWGQFERRFPLPPWAHADAIDARFEHGVLEVNVNRSKEDASGEFRVEIN